MTGDRPLAQPQTAGDRPLREPLREQAADLLVDGGLRPADGEHGPVHALGLPPVQFEVPHQEVDHGRILDEGRAAVVRGGGDHGDGPTEDHQPGERDR